MILFSPNCQITNIWMFVDVISINIVLFTLVKRKRCLSKGEEGKIASTKSSFAIITSSYKSIRGFEKRENVFILIQTKFRFNYKSKTIILSKRVCECFCLFLPNNSSIVDWIISHAWRDKCDKIGTTTAEHLRVRKSEESKAATATASQRSGIKQLVCKSNEVQSTHTPHFDFTDPNDNALWINSNGIARQRLRQRRLDDNRSNDDDKQNSTQWLTKRLKYSVKSFVMPSK